MGLSRDLKDPRWIYAKAIGFLLIGVMGSSLILVRMPDWEVAVALALSVWGFARAYYFLFYVIEHYVDPQFRYSGLLDFVCYQVRQKSSEANNPKPPESKKGSADT
ncbi:MAG: hypothetical protein RJA81_1610 [Planctomycetota bacterium]|jgi:hypothetical protein